MVLNVFKTVTTQEQNLSNQIPARPLYLPETEKECICGARVVSPLTTSSITNLSLTMVISSQQY